MCDNMGMWEVQSDVSHIYLAHGYCICHMGHETRDRKPRTSRQQKLINARAQADDTVRYSSAVALRVAGTHLVH